MLYHEKLHDHYHAPRNRGVLEKPDFQTGSYNPSCGDEIQLSGTVSNGRIQDLRFIGKGCMISQAAASLLTETAQGMTFDHIVQLTAADMSTMVGVTLGPTRMKCVLLSLQALQEGISKISHHA